VRARTSSSWTKRLAVPATVVAVLAAASVGYAVLPGHGRPTVDAGAGLPDGRSLGSVDLSQRDLANDPNQAVSRSATRPEQQPGRSGVETADVPEASDHLWATAELNLWSGPGEDTDLVGLVPDGTRVAVTGAEENGFAEILRDGYARWVNATYLSEDDPETTTSTAPGTVSYAPCRLGSSVESGLTPDAVRVYRAVCAAFPQVTSYGGYRAGDSGEHGTGQALDIMTSDQALGDETAAWVIDHRTELGVSEVLWWQQIWTVERMSEGWRTFPDRGSATANHMDHVHVTVYGESGTG
jgi:Bacterial SH3 domain